MFGYGHSLGGLSSSFAPMANINAARAARGASPMGMSGWMGGGGFMGSPVAAPMGYGGFGGGFSGQPASLPPEMVGGLSGLTGYFGGAIDPSGGVQLPDMSSFLANYINSQVLNQGNMLNYLARQGEALYGLYGTGLQEQGAIERALIGATQGLGTANLQTLADRQREQRYGNQYQNALGLLGGFTPGLSSGALGGMFNVGGIPAWQAPSSPYSPSDGVTGFFEEAYRNALNPGA